MFGNNPILKPLKGDGNFLEVTEIFPTFQGEGPFVGYPSVFLRLGGCNLACKFCDTDFNQMDKMSIEAILKQIKILAGVTHKLVVITGGEPMRQPIEKLCDLLLEQNFSVQIETNGTIYRDLDTKVSIICSPKNNGKNYSQIREDLLKRVTALKFIISSDNENYNHVPDLGQIKYNIPVYLQPMDEYNQIKNQNNLELVKDIATKYGYRISLQLHKIMNIR